MATLTVYGIKNCDTMKKAFAWLDAKGVEYTFHDYKKQGAEKAVLQRAFDEKGWDSVINRKGTTWRALPDDVKEKTTAASALKLALENPSLVKRPLIVTEKGIILGFDADEYAAAFLSKKR
ncbi:MAG: ArsC family reductase [Micavibrio sp.]|nr:ArsC family reductase [Micavibrio sp.]